MRFPSFPVLAATVLVPALLLTGCGDDGRRRGGGDLGTPQPSDMAVAEADGQPPMRDAQPFDAGECRDVVDVVFVLDVSSSMRFVLEQLGDDIGEVVSAAEALAPEPHFGFIGYADNHAFAPNGGGVVHTSASTLSAAFDEFLTTYTNNDRNPGDGPSGPTTQNPICEENSLDALYAAAAEFPWRADATRVIIVATDDTFLERPDNYGDRDGDGDTTSTDYPREGDYPALHTVAETTTLLQDERIRVFSFTRLEPPGFLDLTACGTGRRLNDDDVTDGWTTPYMGQQPFPEATDGTNFDLIRVRDGALSLAETINDVVVESYCDPPLI